MILLWLSYLALFLKGQGETNGAQNQFLLSGSLTCQSRCWNWRGTCWRLLSGGLSVGLGFVIAPCALTFGTTQQALPHQPLLCAPPRPWDRQGSGPYKPHFAVGVTLAHRGKVPQGGGSGEARARVQVSCFIFVQLQLTFTSTLVSAVPCRG